MNGRFPRTLHEAFPDADRARWIEGPHHVIRFHGAMRPPTHPRIPRPITLTAWQRVRRAVRRIFKGY